MELKDLTDEEAELFREVLKRAAERKFYSIELYDWQKEFANATLNNYECMLMAGNRVGKTFLAAYIMTCWGTGWYPDWWKGWKLDKADPLLWVSALTNEQSRDICQDMLCGPDNAMGTGMIPGNLISDYGYRQCGIRHVVDYLEIKNSMGGSTRYRFKAAEQGWEKYQGKPVDADWQDEEPKDEKVVAEQRARLVDTGGRMLVTFTPLRGETKLVQHFTDQSKGKVYLQMASWDDAPHLGEDEKEHFLQSFPEHERKTRTQGIPMMGEGAVFPIADEDIKCDPFPIPPHFRRIAGIDFGINHPAAGCWTAIDVTTDTIYVYAVYKKADELPPYHASVINKQGTWIPVAWPHDGINRDKSGNRIADMYRSEGVNMLPQSARYDNDKGGPQDVEPIVMEVYERLRDGRLKVFSTCQDWFKEKNGMHRKDTKIIALADDIMKACFYAIMMKRYARPEYMSVTKKKAKPLFST